MSSAIRLILCFLILTLSLSAVLAQSFSVSKLNSSAELKVLAVALVRAKSEDEQEVLLAQQKSLVNTALLAALKDQANLFIQKGDYAEAQRISLIALRVAERIGDRAALGGALCDLGSAYGRQMTKAKESLEYLQKSIVIFEELGNKKEEARALQAIGVAYGLQRRYELALEYYNKSLSLSEEVGDRNLTALTLNSIGLAQASMGHQELGLEFYDKARALSEQLNDKSILHMALNNIGTIYISQGRFSEALLYLQKSLKIMEELGADTDRRSRAYKLQNIGLIYRRQGRLDQALAYNLRSLQILVEIDDKFGVANLQNNVGVTYKAQGLYDQSLEWFQKSRQGYESLNNTPGIARVLNNIGDVYRLQGRLAEALEQLQKSLQLREANKDRGGMCLTLNNLGRLYEDQHKYPEMLDVSRRAVAIAEQLYDREDLWDAQDRTGRALAALGQPEEARKSFLAAISTIESLRREVAGGEQQQQSFLENKLSPWLGVVDILVSQQKYAEALTVAEQSKARVLLDALQGGRASFRRSLSKQERDLEEESRLRVVSLNSQLTTELRRDKIDSNRVAQLKSDVDKARLEYEDVETRLYVSHPELKIQRGEAPIIKTEELAALLPNSKTALLEYVVGESRTYLFVVTKTDERSQPDVRLFKVSVERTELAKQTEAFRQQLAKRDLGFRSGAAKLYELLVKPAEAQLRDKSNIIIASDNTLWDLPFQALITDANHFLIERAAVSYTPSLTVLREMGKRKKIEPSAVGPPTLLALGNPTLGNETISRAALTLRDGKLDPLPEAEQEVKALGQLYGASRSKVYIGAEAREDRVKAEASRATILHFATHGTLNNASPMYSNLALAAGGPDQDGLLEAWELMELDLHADLVVLSACETARGRVGAGEGMIGFSWAMFIAGVPSIVVSQWKVESAGTRDLMVNFHRGLVAEQGTAKQNTTKTAALRQAALKLLRNPETSHPFYWAGFVLVGDGS
jgi:CHAT domain-containing protein/Tfp pilus assembly protein PilF